MHGSSLFAISSIRKLIYTFWLVHLSALKRDLLCPRVVLPDGQGLQCRCLDQQLQLPLEMLVLQLDLPFRLSLRQINLHLLPIVLG